MKVLQVVTDRDRRGAQVFAVDLGHGLTELGIDVTTVALTRGRHGDRLPLFVLGAQRYSVRTFAALRREARQHDVVIAHGSSTLLACAIGLVATRVPFVYRQISDPQHWAASWAKRLRVGFFLRRAQAIIVLSASVESQFRRYYGLHGDRLTVIPNAVPNGSFWPASDAERLSARNKFGLSVDSFVAVYIGALAEEKGVDLALDTAADPSVDALLVVGGGPERVSLEETGRHLAPGKVVFTGSVDEPIQALHAADILLLPSRGGDSMPAVLIEAGLCAVPAVSTHVGAITDVVIDGVTGRIVPIGDRIALTTAVRDLADDETMRRQLGEAAQTRCRQQFTIESTAPEWVRVLERIAGSPTGRGRSFASRLHRG